MSVSRKKNTSLIPVVFISFYIFIKYCNLKYKSKINCLISLLCTSLTFVATRSTIQNDDSQLQTLTTAYPKRMYVILCNSNWWKNLRGMGTPRWAPWTVWLTWVNLVQISNKILWKRHSFRYHIRINNITTTPASSLTMYFHF